MRDSGRRPTKPKPRVTPISSSHTANQRRLRTKYKDYWDIPGGYVEPGESPHDAARREVREELGIDVPVGRMLAVDWAPSDKEGDKLLFLFEGPASPPAPRSSSKTAR
jgi:8-oxo-dGTP diphosphatase